MSIISGSAAISTTGSASSFYDFPIGQSLMFDGSSYLSRGQTTGSQTTMTYSAWVKRSDTNNAHLLYDGNASTDESGIYLQGEKPIIEYYHASVGNYYKRGANLLRDFSAWYHLVFVIDTSNSTTAHRMRIYINSVEIVDDVYTAPTPSLSMDFNANGSTAYIGRRGTSATYFNGYLAEINFIDGTALTPSSFGETKNGVWVPKDPSGLTYGANGFRLTFSDSSNPTNDSSGRGNHWTATGF